MTLKQVSAVSLLIVAMHSTAMAGGFRSALKSLAKAGAESTDDATVAASRIAKRLAEETTEHLDDIVRRLPTAGAPSQTAKTIVKELAESGIQDAGGRLRVAIESLEPVERSALLHLFRESRRIVKVATRTGLEEGLQSAVEQGGSRALLTLRAMTTDEGIADCVRGFDRWGVKFADFAQKGDEGAVRAFLKHSDDLSPKQIEEVLAHPTRYFDALGHPSKAFDEFLQSGARSTAPPRRSLLRRSWKTGVVAVGIGAALMLPDSAIDFVETRISKSVGGFLRQFRFVVRLLFLGLVLWLLAPVLFAIWRLSRPVRAVLWKLVPSKHRPRITRASSVIRHKSHWLRLSFLRGRKTLRLGLLGAQRTGKSTFIVMLAHKLQHLEQGASLEPHTHRPDGKVLQDITNEVTTCCPTKDDKTLQLDLTWPFDWAGNELVGGKLDVGLCLTDFPGEWANADAPDENRKRLLEHLSDVDGLFIVIDPTDLEDRDSNERLQAQKRAIESMFKADGLDLGKRFVRAVTVIITKRDALTRDMLARLVGRPNGANHENLERATQLVEQDTLTDEESRELGRWLLDAMYPDLQQAWKTRLASEIGAGHNRRGPWRRLRHWLRWRSRPQLEVFCVSLLGRKLGASVIQHRRAVQQWEDNGKQGAEPTVRLNLEEPPPDTMEFHLPFRWMFNHVPEGLLHEATTRHALARSLYRRLSIYPRFRGAPAVQRAIRTGRLRAVVAVLILVVASVVIKPVMDAHQRHLDEEYVRAVLKEATAGASLVVLRSDIESWRMLQTHPLGGALNNFEQLVRAQGRLSDLQTRITSEKTPHKRVVLLTQWFIILRNLPAPDATWPYDLPNYWDRLAAPYNGNVTRMDTALESDVKHRLKGPRPAYKTIKDEVDSALRRIVRPIGPKSPSPSAITSIAQLSRKVLADWQQSDWNRLTQKIGVLLAATPPDYPSAIGKVGVFIKRPDLIPTRRTVADGRRTTLVRAYWQWTKSQVTTALEQVDRVTAVDLFSRFQLALSSTPAIATGYKPVVAKELKALPSRLVMAAVASSKKSLSNNGPAAAWRPLERAQTSLDGADPPSREAWFKQALEVKRAMAQWADLVVLLRQCTLPQDWVDRQLNTVWNDWADATVREGNSELARGHLDAVKRSVAEFMGLVDNDCPAEALARVQSWAERAIPRAGLEQAVADAKKTEQTDPKASLHILLDARADARHVSDADLLRSWFDTVVRLYEQSHRYREAIRFIRSAAADPALAQHLPANNLVETVAAHFVGWLKAQFTQIMDEQDPASAWKLLLNAERPDADLSESYFEALGAFRKDEIDRVFEELNGVVRQDCSIQDFDGARRHMQEVRAEFGIGASRWQLDGRLDQVLDDIAAAELEWKIGDIDKRIADPSSNPSMIHPEIGILLKSKHLTDDERSRLTSLRRTNLVNWEKRDYVRLYNDRQEREWSSLRKDVTTYLGQTEYANLASAIVRRKAVADIKKWMDKFVMAQKFKVVSVTLSGLPDVLGSNFDPSVEIQILDANGKPSGSSIKTAMWKNAEGTKVIKEFVANKESFSWKSGDGIRITLWDENRWWKAKRMGELTITGPYALLQISRPPTPNIIDVNGFKITVGIAITPKIPALPVLPVWVAP